MRYLLDTHVFLWLQTEPKRLEPVLGTLADRSNDLLLSAASAWEIAIKYGVGRLRLPEPPDSYVPSRLAASGVRELPIESAHALAVAGLPQHHGDPFDRLLVAQAQLLSLVLVTSDRVFEHYEVDLLAV